MTKYSIGEVIRRERKQQKISQEELAFGICTPSWLSKIESGACMPTNTMFESIMRKLGKSTSQYVCYKSDLEIEVEQLKYSIRSHFRMNNLDNARIYLNKLKEKSHGGHYFETQFILLHDILLNKSELSNESILENLETVIQYSIPDFSLDTFEQHLLNQDELVIINNMIIAIRNLGRNKEAIYNMKKMKSYLENPKFDYEEKARSYPLVLANLSKWQGLESDYLGCLSTCEVGITFCIQTDLLSGLASLTLNKGCALAELGSMVLAKQILVQAYHLFAAKNDCETMKLILDFAQSRYNISLNI